MKHFSCVRNALVAMLCLLAPTEFDDTRASTQSATATTQEVPPTYFGLHIHNAATTTSWPSVPFAQWRLWDARVAWPNLEPTKGAWHFQALDRCVELAEKNKVEILLPLGLSPKWASARPNEPSTYQPGNAAEPANTGDWREYVKTIATRYKGRIHQYEIWNEPNLKAFWTGDVPKMVQLTRLASEIIREIDPTAKIVSPSATTMNGTRWLAEFLDDGGGQFVDVIGFHFYVMPQPPEDDVALIQKVKIILRDHGLADKPLWDTEIGWALPKPFPSEDLAAAYLARTFLLNWVGGVQRLFWYSWDNHNWVSIQTTEKDSETLSPAGRAYETIQSWMLGARMESCSQAAGENWICKLNANGAPEWIVWNPSGTATFVPPAEWQAKSAMTLKGDSSKVAESGIEVGPAPVLLHK